MGTIIVGGGLLILVVSVILNMIRKHRQGKSVLCDGHSCGACGAQALCQSSQRVNRPAVDVSQPIRFIKRQP